MQLIPLTQGKFAMVDDQDYPLVSKFKWHAHFDKYNWYAARKVNNGHIRLHNFLMEPPQGVFIDHKDRNGLNCQRANLRICTHQQNSINKRIYKSNKSGFKGVSWRPKLKKWIAQARLNKSVQYLGLFESARDAALAYDRAAERNYGEFAITNKMLGRL